MPKGTNFPAGTRRDTGEIRPSAPKKGGRRPKDARSPGRKGTPSAKRDNGRHTAISGK